MCESSLLDRVTGLTTWQCFRLIGREAPTTVHSSVTAIHSCMEEADFLLNQRIITKATGGLSSDNVLKASFNSWYDLAGLSQTET